MCTVSPKNGPKYDGKRFVILGIGRLISVSSWIAGGLDYAVVFHDDVTFVPKSHGVAS